MVVSLVESMQQLELSTLLLVRSHLFKFVRVVISLIVTLFCHVSLQEVFFGSISPMHLKYLFPQFTKLFCTSLFHFHINVIELC